MILNKIAEKKIKRIAENKKKLPLSIIKDKLLQLNIRRRSFKKAISQRGTINIIAEVKKASPSKGVICEKFDPLRIAYYYEFAGAQAISVLTEEDFFLGKPNYLRLIREVTNRPLLRKDFILDKYQIYESVLLGADAVLLIAAILSPEQIKEYILILAEYNMDALVEVHTYEELENALLAGAEIIGINNRNLYSFEVDLNTTIRLKKFIPNNKIIISESGLSSYEDILSLRSIGVHAFLIGESLLRGDNIIDKLNEFRGVKRIK